MLLVRHIRHHSSIVDYDGRRVSIVLRSIAEPEWSFWPIAVALPML